MPDCGNARAMLQAGSCTQNNPNTTTVADGRRPHPCPAPRAQRLTMMPPPKTAELFSTRELLSMRVEFWNSEMAPPRDAALRSSVVLYSATCRCTAQRVWGRGEVAGQWSGMEGDRAWTLPPARDGRRTGSRPQLRGGEPCAHNAGHDARCKIQTRPYSFLLLSAPQPLGQQHVAEQGMLLSASPLRPPGRRPPGPGPHHSVRRHRLAPLHPPAAGARRHQLTWRRHRP